MHTRVLKFIIQSTTCPPEPVCFGYNSGCLSTSFWVELKHISEPLGDSPLNGLSTHKKLNTLEVPNHHKLTNTEICLFYICKYTHI